MFVSDLALVGCLVAAALARVACCISLLGLALFLLSWVVVCSCYYLFVLFASLVETVGESAIMPEGSSRYRLPKSCLLAGCGPSGRLADATLRREKCYETTSSCPRLKSKFKSVARSHEAQCASKGAELPLPELQPRGPLRVHRHHRVPLRPRCNKQAVRVGVGVVETRLRDCSKR